MKIFNKYPYLIAEIGVNFYDIAEKEGMSDMAAAKFMISEAKECGVDAVMFKSYKAEKIASKNSPAYWDLSEEPTASQFELFKKFDKFGVGEYRELAEYCQQLGIKFMSTPFDFESVDYLDEFMDIFKISSSDLTNIPFIKYIASKNKPILLSTGAATINEINGNLTTYSDNGRVAISYRGFENPWGNTWRFVGGCKVIGDGTVDSGTPYICDGYNYNDEEEYSNIGFCLPNVSGWISAMGYGEKSYDWIYMPAQCSGANDAAPVGDNLWTTRDLNDTNVVAAGGSWSFGTSNGPFYYGCDRNYNYFSNSYNPRLLFIPTKNNIYTANHQKWLARVGGNGV